ETGDVWALELASASSWHQLLPAGEGPSPRFGHGSVFDEPGRRMVVFGGGTYDVQRNDTWLLDFDVVTPTLVSLYRVHATPQGVTLTWASRGSGPTAARVERRDGPRPWETLATIESDGSGRLEYTDRDVVPGRRYGYRLILRSSSGETATEE